MRGLTFIEGHAQKNGARIMISVPHITVVTPLDGYVRIYTDDGDYTDVTDSYDDIVAAIQKVCSTILPLVQSWN